MYRNVWQWQLVNATQVVKVRGTHSSLDEVEHVAVPSTGLVDSVELAASVCQLTSRRVLEVVRTERGLWHHDEDKNQ